MGYLSNGMCEQGHYSDIVDFLPGIELKTDKGKRVFI